MASSTEQAGVRLKELLERIANTAGVAAEVEVHAAGDGLAGEYIGDDLRVLIGRHGQTIDAIQHLAYRIAGRVDGERISIIVDAAGYRERRAQTLRQAADQAAQAALAEDRAVSLEPMTALERKVIHEHLKARREIETYSEGEEPSRHLVVAPVV